MNLPDTQYGQHANNMMAWLEAMKINKTSPRQPLEQQLQALSLSYKNAQQKLLSLQKQVYHESLYNEKQRSIIQILKYIINGSLDDETILSYLVDMQQQSVSDLDLKYQIKTQLQQIKQMVLKHKTQDKKRQSMKGVALSDLKKELIKCNQIKKQLMEDLDRTLNQKGALETVMQEMKNQSNQQQQIKISLQLKIQQLSIQISQLNLNNESLKCEMNKKDQLLRQNQETLTNISRSLSKLLGSPEQKLQNPSKILKQMKRVEDKLQKYRSLAKELNEKIKKQSQHSQVLSIIHEFLPQQAVKLWQQYEKTSQKCLLKQIEGMAKLQKKKYSQLQHCQQEVWRLKSRLLRDGGSWLKSGRTGATISGNKQNINKNRIEQDQVAEFEIEIQDQKST